jgi:hypothetical protein
MKLKFFVCPTGKYHSAYSPYALHELSLAPNQQILVKHEKNSRSFLSILDRMQCAKKPSHATVPVKTHPFLVYNSACKITINIKKHNLLSFFNTK